MDMVPEPSVQAHAEPPQAPSPPNSRLSPTSNGSGYSSDRTLLCISSNIGTVLRAPDTFKRYRSISGHSYASNDSGYYSDNIASKASCSFSLDEVGEAEDDTSLDCFSSDSGY